MPLLLCWRRQCMEASVHESFSAWSVGAWSVGAWSVSA
ncbi:hypothetical protein SynBIOSU31_01969 [Synechococcus sp. BIOS-U3-1]|nr:hypothetical protein SynBIOSU31_01969 [Synechococcus sp. BIOS-U3-1]